MALGVFSRFVTVVFALAFEFVNVSPAFDSPCPVHDPAFASLGAAQHHGHSAANHSAMGHSHAGKSSHSADEHGQNCCKCIGCASCVAPFSLALPNLAFAPAEVQAGTNVPVVRESVSAARLAEYLLPYPTAPPQTLGV